MTWPAPAARTNRNIAGAADETDAEIIKYIWGLYDRLKLQRIYFSAYQKGLGEEKLPAEKNISEPEKTFVREHRLYQVDFLLRKYGFTEQDMVFGENGNLSLETDPKQAWADANLELFPVAANSASKYELLRVPGLGPITVNRILKIRTRGRLRSIEDIGKAGVRLTRAEKYLRF